MAAITVFSYFGTEKIESVTVSIFLLCICHEVMGPDAMVFVFWMLSFKPAFSLSFTIIKRLFSSSLCFLALGCCHLHIWGCWYFSRQSWFKLVLHPAWCYTNVKNEFNTNLIHKSLRIISHNTQWYMLDPSREHQNPLPCPLSLFLPFALYMCLIFLKCTIQ